MAFEEKIARVFPIQTIGLGKIFVGQTFRFASGCKAKALPYIGFRAAFHRGILFPFPPNSSKLVLPWSKKFITQPDTEPSRIVPIRSK